MYFMDCHCHMGVDGHLQDPVVLMDKLNSDPRISKGFFNIMSTNHLDLAFLAALIDLDEHQVLVPHFGIHPWYSHLFSTDPTLGKYEHYDRVLSALPDKILDALPEPIYIEDHMQRITELVRKCQDSGRAYAIGEIGLDKLFRIPTNGFYGNQDQKTEVSLTAAKVSMDHQKAVFLRQLEFANKHQKPVSLHCVKAQGPFFDIVCSSYLQIPAVVLHSYTGSLDQARRWIKEFAVQKRSLYFSFSNYINGEDDKKNSLAELVALLKKPQILVETDMPIDRYFLTDRVHVYFHHLHEIQGKIAHIQKCTEAETNAALKRNSLRLHNLSD